MASKTEILNWALGHLAVGKNVGNIETENSAEAREGRRWYSIALQTTLEAAPWPFATLIEPLALVEEEPNAEWGYSYRYPSRCAKMVRILSGVRTDTRQSRVSYKIIQDSQGRLILTDMEDAEVEYIINNPDSALYSNTFQMALSRQLAFLMGPNLTSGDQFKLAVNSAAIFQLIVSQAESRAFNEQQDEEDPDSEFIRDRE